jgi:signal peptidase I
MYDSWIIERVPEQPRRSTARRLLSLTTNAVFVLGALLALAAAAVYVGMRAEGYRFYEVETGSMAPALEVGAVVGIKQTRAHEVKAGDVIAFERQGNVLIHRVTRVQSAPDFRTVIQNQEGVVTHEGVTYAPRTFYTKGDANATQDAFTVPQEDLLGVQTFTVPWPLNLFATHLTKEALLILGAGAFALFLVWELTGIVRDWRARRRQRYEVA